jgi:quinol monooxygenase YgiN
LAQAVRSRSSDTWRRSSPRFEVWRNPAALEEHQQTPHIKASFAKRQQQGWKTEITPWKRGAD